MHVGENTEDPYTKPHTSGPGESEIIFLPGSIHPLAASPFYSLYMHPPKIIVVESEEEEFTVCDILGDNI